MEITINVDESMFSEVLDKELKALSEEELKEIIKQGIAECLRANNFKRAEALIFDKYKSPWDISEKTTINSTAEKILRDMDYSELQDVVDKCIELLKSDYENLLMNTLLKNMACNLADTYEMERKIRTTIDDHLRKYKLT